MPDRPDRTWLDRLSVEEWLAAAENELVLGEGALGRRAFRPAVTHARRAAGMALNAVLRASPEALSPGRWGRSYMEHVLALCDEESAPADVREAARILRETPPRAPDLVSLGQPDRSALEAARRIVDWAREVSAAGTGS